MRRSPITSLRRRADEIIRQHGSLRAAARALEIDPGYLSRLHDGKKLNPSAATLRRMGLRQEFIYIRIKGVTP